MHSDIISRKSVLFQFTGQPYCKDCQLAKVKYGIINLILRNYLVDRYMAVTVPKSSALALAPWIARQHVGSILGGVHYPRSQGKRSYFDYCGTFANDNLSL
jgi:hypothetical protein